MSNWLFIKLTSLAWSHNTDVAHFQEAQIAVMQNKLRKAIHDVEEAEERSAMLETQLVRGGRGGNSTTRITTRRVVSYCLLDEVNFTLLSSCFI